MPGKVNPVIPEAVCMVCARVMGNHTAITVAGQSGNFQLNVMLPMVAYNLLQSIELLSTASVQLADAAIAGFTVREARRRSRGAQPDPRHRAEPGHRLRKRRRHRQAGLQGRPPDPRCRTETTGLSDKQLKKLLDPAKLAKGGIHGEASGGG